MDQFWQLWQILMLFSFQLILWYGGTDTYLFTGNVNFCATNFLRVCNEFPTVIDGKNGSEQLLTL